MGSVDKCDATLPLNEMMFYVRKSKELRDQDVRALHDLGVHQYYVPQMLRLFFGASANSNAHPALEAYKRAYPEESARALALAEKLENR